MAIRLGSRVQLCSAVPLLRGFSSAIQLSDSPYAIQEALLESGERRAYAVYNPVTEAVDVSHECMAPLKTFLEADKVDFLKHEAIFLQVGARTNALCGAFIWNTVRGQGCGGIRLRSYDSGEEYIRDGLRLAIGMGRKSALAGLWAGGAKGVIAQAAGDKHHDPAYRKDLFDDYGEFLSSLRGCYVAAEDVGLNVTDCDMVFGKTRYMTCISPELGGSGNPSVPTADGVRAAMVGALGFLNMGTLAGKSVAVQGLGNVASPLIDYLLESGVARVVASDVTSEKVEAARERFKTHGDKVELRLTAVGDNSILSEQVDIVAPCGFGAVLNEETIGALKCKIVCGAANNQLADPVNGDAAIQNMGITYVPDFVANRMGIVNCANEQYGRVGKPGDHTDDPAIARHLQDENWENSVINITKTVLQKAQDDQMTPGQAANELADYYCTVEHPIWGHRSQHIINSLLRDGWVDGLK